MCADGIESHRHAAIWRNATSFQSDSHTTNCCADDRSNNSRDDCANHSPNDCPNNSRDCHNSCRTDTDRGPAHPGTDRLWND
jgi:hypothetical protein